MLRQYLSRDGNLHLHTSLDVHNDRLNNLGGGVEINQTLVDAHLEAIPCFGSFTARCLPCCHLERLCREANGTFNAQVLGLCTSDEFGAHLLEGLDFAAG